MSLGWTELYPSIWDLLPESNAPRSRVLKTGKLDEAGKHPTFSRVFGGKSCVGG